jgi:ankyrin repeat protein
LFAEHTACTAITAYAAAIRECQPQFACQLTFRFTFAPCAGDIGQEAAAKIRVEGDTNKYMCWYSNDGDVELLQPCVISDPSAASRARSYGFTKKTVSLLLEYRADVNEYDCTRVTALMKAARDGYISMISVLLEFKADVNALDMQTPQYSLFHQISSRTQKFAPMFACGFGHADAVRLLLEHRADVDIKDNVGGTALIWASADGHCDVVELLLQNEARNARSRSDKILFERFVNAEDKDGKTSLYEAARGGREATVRLLLEHRADVHAVDNDGRTALSQSMLAGHRSVVLLLLEQESALIFAAYQGRVDAVRLLLERRADPSARDNVGRTALIWASARGNFAVVELLLQIEARNARSRSDKILFERFVNAEDKNGKTSLYEAARGGHEATVRLLLEHRADVNASQCYGDTSLMVVAGSGNPQALSVMRILIENKADVNAVSFKVAATIKGVSGLMIAARNSKHSSVQLLIEHRAHVNAAADCGRTALMYAAANGREFTLPLMLEHRADVNAVNKKGETALTMAALKYRQSCVRILEKVHPENTKDCDEEMAP